MDNFGERLKFLRGKTSQSDLSALFGIKQTRLSNYERCRNEPNYDLVKAICSHFDVNIEWFLFGTGPMRNDEAAPHQAAVDREILRSAIEAVEEGLAVTHRTLSPDKKAALVMAAYDLIEESGSAGKVIELIRIVA
jgi:transcriptional regulator with XRE-family HTH domain